MPCKPEKISLLYRILDLLKYLELYLITVKIIFFPSLSIYILQENFTYLCVNSLTVLSLNYLAVL